MKIEGSSHIDRATYSSADKALYVRFLNGATYEYRNVPAEKWEGLQKAESKGKYLHSQIVPVHRGWQNKTYKWEDD